MRRGAAIAGALLLLAVTGAGSATAAPGAQQSVLEGITDSDQVVIVSATSSRSTTASIARYQRTSQGWQQIGRAARAYVGRSGLVPGGQRRQSTGTTPMGTFALNAGFGRRADPGTKLPYTHIDRNDAWTYNPRVPSTYNLFQDADRSWRSYGGYVEHLWQLGPQYDYVVTTSFNEPQGPITRTSSGVRITHAPSDTARGGGIFLHVSKGEPTVGCVSMARPVMRALVRWLDPADHPVVVIGLDLRP